ncbi:energy transducer TonB [Magnetospirillum sulfuroxidans]|uniref:Energy transducer TonB n=1 Tax=Magnetospirillum sulfuroxidans TaxID=611300 RepID=A0ABS5I933_9PROT|nr:energy transducer TonB [Magnetospirillum sulfuroxidans]MBR9970948.1 energy transducer TonB [Magnetospirillum sulfuroxidans]
MMIAGPRLCVRADPGGRRRGPVAAAVLHGAAALALLGIAPPLAPQPPQPLLMVEFVTLPPPAPTPTAPTPIAAAPIQKPPSKPVATIPRPPPAPKTIAAKTIAVQNTTPVAETEVETKADNKTVDQGVEPAAAAPTAAIAAATAGNGTKSGDEADSLPNAHAAYLNNPKPPYPTLARRRGLEGVVILMVRVDELGHVATLNVQRSSGHSVLDQSALETVKSWRFVPARRAGHTVEAAIEIPIRFALTGTS